MSDETIFFHRAAPGVGHYRRVPGCPFCGSRELRITDWFDEDGKYDAIECGQCKAAAPANIWPQRAGGAA